MEIEGGGTMRKVFMISQPMSGKSELEIENKRKEITRYLKSKGHDVINTHFTDSWICQGDTVKDLGIKHIRLAFMAEALHAMSTADAVFFCDGWSQTKGCSLEHEAARKYGLELYYEEDYII